MSARALAVPAAGHDTPGPDASDDDPDGPKRVLLVNDEAHVLRVMRLNLDRNGYEVDTALDPEVALRMLREECYAALIVCEELAPGGRGLCASAARMLGVAAPLMLVMDSDHADADDARTARVAIDWKDAAAGVERLECPVSLRHIVSRLNAYFEDHERPRVATGTAESAVRRG